MGTGHGHAPGGVDTAATDPALHRRVVVLLAIVLVPLFALVVALLVALWPVEDPATYLPEGGRFAQPGVLEMSATVTAVETFACEGGAPGVGTDAPPTVCGRVSARLEEGPEAASIVEVDVPPVAVAVGFTPGQEIRLSRVPPAEGQAASYGFADFSRGMPLAALAAAFALLVVLVARVRGLLALLGLGLSFLVIVKFMLPALLLGGDPLLVGGVGCSAILFVVLYLAHGISIRTTTALIGTLFGLTVAALLGAWAVRAAHLTGGGSEEALVVGSVAGRLQLSALLLAGIVIAGLGVLNDVTVTQASAVWELHALEPGASAGRLFAGAMRIGRDHIASSVYTIAFAYAGASLPVLLLILLYQRPLAFTLSSELVAPEIVSILVGAIALVLAVPLTTAVGVAFIRAASLGRGTLAPAEASGPAPSGSRGGRRRR